MVDPYIGKKILAYTNNGNEYSGLFVRIQWLAPHKYLVIKLDKSVGPFEKGDLVKLKTDSIESFK